MVESMSLCRAALRNNPVPSEISKVAEEQKDKPQTEKPAEKAAEPTEARASGSLPAARTESRGSQTAASAATRAKPAAPAAPPKPKGPLQEPWTSPLVDALKEKFGEQIVKSYSPSSARTRSK